MNDLLPSDNRTDAELIDQARKWTGDYGEGPWFRAMADRIEMMRAALESIREGRGAYSRDQYTFACNVIEESKRIATEALEDRYEYNK